MAFDPGVTPPNLTWREEVPTSIPSLTELTEIGIVRSSASFGFSTLKARWLSSPSIRHQF
ncbi:hypothetical protein CDEST_08512 [Colletotrichum destructivum]|uniref:Uncharacterized protein n=1 Tax=Colletotrichum destructivum TaxID=34406 RepID=A0AAX4IL93_9PEZI|nr:hypothetical protein CDEST_08512 [Colletotrichum destructivum]